MRDRVRPGAGFVNTGHRGARGLAPENTLPAFARGAAEGADILELDVQRTRDGHTIVIHDETLARTSDASGRLATSDVAELTLEEVRSVDAGYRFTRDGGQSFPFRGRDVRVPLLSEVLESHPRHLFTIEIKPSPHPEHVPATIELIRQLAPGRALIGAFEHTTLMEVRERGPEIPTSASLHEIQRFFFAQLLGLAGCFKSAACALQVPRFSDHDHDRGIRVTTRRFVRAAHATGRSVQVWTINEPALMDELLAMDVDGITTDRPDLVRGARAAWQR